MRTSSRSFRGALALAAVATLLVIAACNDDDRYPTPTPGTVSATATASATPTPEVTTTATPAPTTAPTQSPGGGLPVGPDEPGEAGFRTFLRRLDAGLQAQGALAVKARWKTIDVTCRAEDVPQRADGAFCEQAGQRYQGVESSTWRSSGGISPVDRVNARLDEATAALRVEVTDRYGNGAMHVHATSVSGGVYRTVVTAVITSPPEFGPQRPIRVAWLLTWDYSDGAWKATKIMFAYVLAEDLLDPTAEGRGIVPNWQRYP